MTVQFKLQNIDKYAINFLAYFTTESDKVFAISPGQGRLPSHDQPGELFQLTFAPHQYGQVNKVIR